MFSFPITCGRLYNKGTDQKKETRAELRVTPSTSASPIVVGMDHLASRRAAYSTGAMKRRWVVGLLVATAGLVEVVSACSISFPIWSIRSKTADPLFRFVHDGKVGYIDVRGKIVVPPTLPDQGTTFYGEFHDGLLRIPDGKRSFRYIDQSGATVVRVNAWLAFDFADGLAPASIASGAGRTWQDKWGFIDKGGQFVIAPRYFWVSPFSEGLAKVEVEGEVGSTGYIRKNGSFAIPPRLSYGADYHEGLAAVVIDGPCAMSNGGSCAPPVLTPTRANPTYDCRYSYIDAAGRPVSPTRFDGASDFSEGLAAVRIGDRSGFIDRTGEIVIPLQFEWAQSFSEGLAAVRQGGRTGYIDHSGRFLIPPRFQSGQPFSDTRALVSVGDDPFHAAYRYIEKTGEVAFPGEYTIAESFTHGLAPVRLKSGPLAWIDPSGKTILEFEDSGRRR
jgi:hypothetical protein